MIRIQDTATEVATGILAQEFEPKPSFARLLDLRLPADLPGGRK